MSTKEILQSRHFRVVTLIIGIFLVASLSFAAGVKVGFHKAMFSSKWGKNYERNFLDGRGERGDKHPMSPMERMEGKGMRNGHGVAGEILSISNDTVIIKNPENQETTVRINESTIINRGPDTVTLTDLVAGERVVIVGKPQDDGVIAAHLIRVFPRNTNQ